MPRFPAENGIFDRWLNPVEFVCILILREVKAPADCISVTKELHAMIRKNATIISCVLYFAVIVIFLNCSPNKPETEMPRAHFSGMVLVHAQGTSFVQGSNDSAAPHDAKPAFGVQFTYDFWIDTTEITREYYQEVSGKSPSNSATGACPSCPVTGITWYDAALFCNKRSIIAKLDTVYSYSGIDSTAIGKVYGLRDLRIRYEAHGYRLPTESEWEYCAKAGSSLDWEYATDTVASQYAWYSANSKGQAHPVARLKPNQWNIYDLNGNVSEWTNDAKGPYPATPVNNPIGSPEPQDFERAVKGGAYSEDLLSLRPVNRSNAYPTLPSAALHYVGFRCVVGAINHPCYFSNEGGILASPAFSVVDPDIAFFVGSFNTKIAFVHFDGAARLLTAIHFTSSAYHIYEYSQSTNVHAPVISPNGEWVAYCTGDMGGQGASAVFIQRLDSLGSGCTQLSETNAFFPHWWVDPATKDTFLVYTSSAVFNSNAAWQNTKTIVQKISGGKPHGSPRIVTSDGSFYGGLSYSGRFIATGYPRLLIRDLQSNTTHRLFLGPENGKGANDSSQVCNVSISPDSGVQTRALFLDYGYNAISVLVGASYTVHQIIFMADYSSTVNNWYWCPTMESRWDHPKWSNDPRFAIAVGVGADDSHHSVYLINLLKNSFYRILSGNNLLQPCLWIDPETKLPPAANLSFDSLGRYNDPPTMAGQAEFAQKLILFWHSFDSLEIAFLGSSMIRDGIDPAEIVHFRSFNLGFGGGDFLAAKTLIESYILNHCKRIKLIVLSLDMGWMANPDADYSWKEHPSQTAGFKYDQNHAFWKNGLPANFLDYIGAGDGTYTTSGFHPATAFGWGNNPPVVHGRTDWDCTDSNYIHTMDQLSNLLNELSARGIHLLVINFPVSPYYKNSSSYSTWGPSWGTATEILNHIRSLESQNPNFHFYDVNLNGNHDFSDGDANNENHLSGQGASKLTSRLNTVIDSLLK